MANFIVTSQPARPRRLLTWATAGRSRTICLLQLRFDRGAPGRRRCRELRAQLFWLLVAVSPSTEFRGMQASTHDDAPCKRLFLISGRRDWSANSASRVAYRSPEPYRGFDDG